MFALRTTRAAARIVPRATGRRFASHDHHTPDPHHHHGPKEESFGKGFYISIASLIGVMAFFKAEQATARTDKSLITRLIDKYTDSQELWAEKSHLHTAKVEQAGRDRSLFMDSTKSGIIPLRNLENFNIGSPYNHEAGRAGGNLVELARKLEGTA